MYILTHHPYISQAHFHISCELVTMSQPSKKRKMAQESEESPADIITRNVEQFAAIKEELHSLRSKVRYDDPLYSRFHKAKEEAASNLLGRVFFEKLDVFPLAVWQVFTTHHFSLGHPIWSDPLYA